MVRSRRRLRAVRRAAVPKDMRADAPVNPARRAAVLIATRMLFGSIRCSGRIAEGKSQSFGLSAASRLSAVRAEPERVRYHGNAALGDADVNHHAPAVEIADFEIPQFVRAETVA